MKQMKKFVPWIIVVSLLPIAFGVLAQSGGDYEIVTWTVNNGGGESQGGDYHVTGTAGQYDAGTLQGGDYVLTGGFWRPALPGSVDGAVSLQGRTDHSGVEICGWDGVDLAGCTTTDAAGNYSLSLHAGSYDITVEMARYLDSEQLSLDVAAGVESTQSTLTLKGGDSNNDDIVNILDLSFMGARYQCTTGDTCFDTAADINDDGLVNIQDIVLGGSNYQQSSPLPWP